MVEDEGDEVASHPKNQLTAIGAIKKGPGRHLDGNGLYLVVEPSGSRSWILRIVIRGKRTDLGLGGINKVPLAAARLKATRLREIVGAGGDPRVDRDAARAKRVTFRAFAEQYVKDHRPEWKNAKHAAQWNSTLETHAYPVFGERIVADVDSTAILAALRPIWTKTPETATRLRARLETILGAAKAVGLRTGDNPAEWAGALEASLPRDQRKKRVKHHPALPYKKIGEFMQELGNESANAAVALRLTILTAARTNEIIGARWSEFDLDEMVWTVPAARMKAGKEHRVPLSQPACDLLAAHPHDDAELVFAGRIKAGQERLPMSNMAMLQVLKRMGYDGITVHGFRSTFRDWTGEQTAHPREVAEHALAHQLADESEAAYQRGTLLHKRRALMDDWAAFCARAPL